MWKCDNVAESKFIALALALRTIFRSCLPTGRLAQLYRTPHCTQWGLTPYPSPKGEGSNS
jgi:hypothetical protein